jgi:hypothetical protein
MIEKSALLPARKHKLVMPNNVTIHAEDNNPARNKNASNRTPGYFMPFNTPCFLHNMYGPDYMIPKEGKSSQAKFGKEHGRHAFYNPACNDKLTTFEADELNRQSFFCSGNIPKLKK